MGRKSLPPELKKTPTERKQTGGEEDCGGRGGGVPQRAKRPKAEQFEE